MSEHRITRLVFRVEGVLLAEDGALVEGMPALVAELAQVVEVWAAADRAAGRERLVAIDYYGALIPAERVILAQANDPAAVFDGLVRQGVIVPGHTIWVDRQPKRAMVAIRRGLDAALFEDAARLYRDLGLWGLVPLIPEKDAAWAHLRKGR